MGYIHRLRSLLPRTGPEIAVLAILGVSLGFNVYLRIHTTPYGRTAAPKLPALAAGTILPEITAAILGGGITTIDWSSESRPTVLYIFRPSCVWCNRNIDNLRTVAEAAGTKYRVVGLSVTSEGLKEYVSTHDLHFPVYAVHDLPALRHVWSGVTPQTIVVSAAGRVIHSWNGAYSGSIKSEVELQFGVRLPGFVKSAGQLPVGTPLPATMLPEGAAGPRPEALK